MKARWRFPGVARVAEDAAPTSIPDKPTLPKLNVLLPAGPSGTLPCIPAKIMEDSSDPYNCFSFASGTVFNVFCFVVLFCRSGLRTLATT